MATFMLLQRTTLVLIALASIGAAISLQFVPSGVFSLASAQTPLLLALLALLMLPAPTLAARRAARRTPQVEPAD